MYILSSHPGAYRESKKGGGAKIDENWVFLWNPLLNAPKGEGRTVAPPPVRLWSHLANFPLNFYSLGIQCRGFHLDMRSISVSHPFPSSVTLTHSLTQRLTKVNNLRMSSYSMLRICLSTEPWDSFVYITTLFSCTFLWTHSIILLLYLFIPFVFLLCIMYLVYQINVSAQRHTKYC